MNETKTEITNLTASKVARQNVLNNRYALDNIKKSVGIRCVFFDGEYKILMRTVADFFEVSERAIKSVISKNHEELEENGYAVLEDNALEHFKMACKKQLDSEVIFTTKTTRLSTFTFRAFLNVAMLLNRSEKAKVLRSVILDIVIDTISERAGGSTKYINGDIDLPESLKLQIIEAFDKVEQTDFHVSSQLMEIPAGVPVVFISYSWDSEEHRQWVRRLADDLQMRYGIFVLCDCYNRHGEELVNFMVNAIERADRYFRNDDKRRFGHFVKNHQDANMLCRPCRRDCAKSLFREMTKNTISVISPTKDANVPVRVSPSEAYGCNAAHHNTCTAPCQRYRQD